MFKEKVNARTDGRTTDTGPWHKLAGLRPVELKMKELPFLKTLLEIKQLQLKKLQCFGALSLSFTKQQNFRLVKLKAKKKKRIDSKIEIYLGKRKKHC